jgi:putative phage-type endonuclease
MLNLSQSNELKDGIGASECSIVLGINPYKTPYELWLEKTGRKEPDDLSQNAAVIMGNLLEPVIAKRYAQLTGTKVARVNRALKHKDFPHIICHLDRKILGEQKAVEIKTANPFSKEWGNEGTDEVPLHYIAQVQQQLAVTGWNEADLIVFRGTTDLRIYPFKRDEDLIKTIVEKVNHFWNYHIKRDISPEPTTRGDLKLIYPVNEGHYIEKTPHIALLMEALRLNKEHIKTTTGYKEKNEFELIKLIGSSDGIKEGDDIVASFIANKIGVRSLRMKGNQS